MKIYILGSSGTGKTTYGKKLSKDLNIPIYPTDEMYDYDKKEMFSQEKIKEVVDINGDWIIEGAYYIPEYIRAADKVVCFSTSPLKRFYRIWKRWFTNEEIRNKYTFGSTLRLAFRTILRDVFLIDNINVNTNVAKHYKERDRFNLAKHNAKEIENITT